MKKQVQRTCIGCNQKKDKNDFIRIVKNKENIVCIDETGKKEGRGAYLCKDKNCFEKIVKNKRLERVFDRKLSDEFYQKLRGVMFDE